VKELMKPMKRINELGLIILISIGVICCIYWIKQTPTGTGHDVKACIEATEADVAGSSESRQNPAAWKKSIASACKNSE
jgi:hypothetical protein